MHPQQPDYYEREQPDEKRPLQAFHQFLLRSLIRTDNPVTSKKEEFVPFEQIEEYFDEDENRLIDVLSAVFPDEEPIPVRIISSLFLHCLCFQTSFYVDLLRGTLSIPNIYLQLTNQSVCNLDIPYWAKTNSLIL